MFAKIKSGNHFKGAIDYVMDIYDNGKHSHIIGHSDGIFTMDNKTIASCFEAYAKRGNNSVPEPVMHIALSFSKYDDRRLTDELMTRIVEDYMRQMGYTDVEYMICRHHDKEHPHCHLLFCAVNNKGKAVKRSNERLRNKNVCKLLTLKYGLYMSSGKEGVHRDRLRGIDKAKYDMYDKIRSCKECASNWKEFEQLLKVEGISMKFHINNTTGKLMGVVFSDGKFSFSGRKIDRSLTLPKLKEKFGDFKEIMHESVRSWYQAYKEELTRRNGGMFSSTWFRINRLFPDFDTVYPKGMPDFRFPDMSRILSTTKGHTLIDSGDAFLEAGGRCVDVSLDLLFVMMEQPYAQQLSIGGGGGCSGGWRDVDDKDKDKWKFRVNHSILHSKIAPTKYIKPKYSR